MRWRSTVGAAAVSAGKIVLALDGMGGDHAPDVIVNGADIARERYPGTSFLLFGDEARLKALVDKRKGLAQVLEIVPAEDAVLADDKPSFALRRRRKSSMWLAVEAAAQGRADTIVSAGNTGALLAISMFAMRMLEGADRPALASFMPTARGETRDARPRRQSRMRRRQSRAVRRDGQRVRADPARPRRAEGRPAECRLRGAQGPRGSCGRPRPWLRREGSPVSFHGFVEGNDIGAGTVDVVVTDGFTGNVALKTDRRHGEALHPVRPRRVPDLDLRQARLPVRLGRLDQAAQARRSAALQRRRVPRSQRRVREEPRRHRRAGLRLCDRRGRRLVRYDYKSKLVEGLARLREIAAATEPPAPALQAAGGTA